MAQHEAFAASAEDPASVSCSHGSSKISVIPGDLTPCSTRHPYRQNTQTQKKKEVKSLKRKPWENCRSRPASLVCKGMDRYSQASKGGRPAFRRVYKLVCVGCAGHIQEMNGAEPSLPCVFSGVEEGLRNPSQRLWEMISHHGNVSQVWDCLQS